MERSPGHRARRNEAWLDRRRIALRLRAARCRQDRPRHAHHPGCVGLRSTGEDSHFECATRVRGVRARDAVARRIEIVSRSPDRARPSSRPTSASASCRCRPRSSSPGTRRPAGAARARGGGPCVARRPPAQSWRRPAAPRARRPPPARCPSRAPAPAARPAKRREPRRAPPPRARARRAVGRARRAGARAA